MGCRMQLRKKSTNALFFLVCAYVVLQQDNVIGDVWAFRMPSAFCSRPTTTSTTVEARQKSVSFVAIDTRLDAFKKPPPPEDPYANLLRNYQKKDALPEVSAPPPVVEAPPAAVEPAPPVVDVVQPVVEAPPVDTDASSTAMGSASAAAAKMKATAAASMSGGFQLFKESAEKSMNAANEAVTKQLSDAKQLVETSSTSSIENLDNAKNSFMDNLASSFDFIKSSIPPPPPLPIQVPDTTTRGIATLEKNVLSAEMRAMDTLAKKEADLKMLDPAAMKNSIAEMHFSFNDFITLLKLEENAGWYVAALIAVLAIAGRAEETTSDGVVRHGNDGSSTRKKLRKEIERLKGEVSLAESTMEKKKDAEITKLLEENALLKQQLASSSATGTTFPSFATETTTFDKEDEELYDEHMTGDDDDDDEDARRKAREEARLEKAKKVEEMVRAELKGVQSADTAHKKKLFEVAARKAVAEALEKKTKASAKKATKKTAKKGKKATVAKKTKTTLKKPVVAQANGAHPWAALAPSKLGRKTVKELSEFLHEKGVATVDDNGKKIMKKELLAKVKSLL